MQPNTKAAIVGSFIGDAMAMGVHWVYDTDAIAKEYGKVASYVTPKLASYHEGKRAGDFTHYGDQMFELLISVSGNLGFHADDFMARWRALFKSGRSVYKDQATKNVLENILECAGTSACGAPSTDLGGASRIAPLLSAYDGDLNALKTAAVAETEITHNNLQVIESARFFAELAFKTLRGERPSVVMREIVGSGEYRHIAESVRKGLESKVDNPIQAVEILGQSCSVSDALPSTVYLIKRFEDDFIEAIVTNTMAGGDSAARGMLIGMIIGARVGMNGIPAGWFEGMNKHEDIVATIGHRAHHHYYEYAGVDVY